MAEQLIDSLSTDFDPSAYHDEYREQLLALIERKAEGKEIVASDAETPKATKAPDLMAALEESIAAAQGKGGAKHESENRARRNRLPKRKKPPPKKSPPARSKAARGRNRNRSRSAPWRRAARSRSTVGS